MLPTIKLNETTRNAIERSVGVVYSDIVASSAEEVDAVIEKRLARPLPPSTGKEAPLFMSRGSVYLSLQRFLDVDVDKRLEKI